MRWILLGMLLVAASCGKEAPKPAPTPAATHAPGGLPPEEFPPLHPTETYGDARVGMFAKDVVLKDLKGETFRLSEWLAQYPVLLVFTRPDCEPAVFGQIQRLHEQHRQRGLEVVQVLTKSTEAEARAFIAAHSIRHLVLPDPGPRYGQPNNPQYILIDRTGHISYSQSTAPRLDDVIVALQ